MEKNNRVSIVMPVYNHVEYIDEAIQSILNQTYYDFELVIVDDGSTDGSSEKAKSYLSKDSRVKYIRKENGGTGSALNVGFSMATGFYGTWVSSDNVYYESMIAKFVEFLPAYPQCRFVFSGFSINGDKKYLIYNKEGIFHNFLKISEDQCCTGICYMFSMDLKRECGDYIDIPGEDYLMGVKMGLRTEVGYIPEILGMYRYHTKSLTYMLGIDSSPMTCKKSGKTALVMVRELLGAHMEKTI